MAAILDASFALKLCDILYLNPKKVKSIVIKSIVCEPVTVNVEFYLQDFEAPKMLELMRSYKIIDN
jgi:hypothetical protein